MNHTTKIGDKTATTVAYRIKSVVAITIWNSLVNFGLGCLDSAHGRLLVIRTAKVSSIRNLTMFATLFFCFTFVHQVHFDAPTPASRLDLLDSLVYQHKVDIDENHENTPDKALFGGHYYSDKAPGTVAAALGPYYIAAKLSPVFNVRKDSRSGSLFRSWIACASALGLVTALAGLACYRICSLWIPEFWAFVCTLGLFLGAAPFPYCTMLFSHSLVIAALCIALWLGTDPLTKLQALRPPMYVDIAIGACCGLSLASEYSAGVVVIAVILYLYWRRPKDVLKLILGAIPIASLIPLYSWLCIGSLFALPYSYQASFPGMHEGFFGIKCPDPITATKLLFSPARGLMFWSPFLVLCAIGYREVYERARSLFWLSYLAPVAQIIIFSGRSWDWLAGPSLGPRYLAPILPVLAVPCGIGLQKAGVLGAVLVAYSIVVTSIATLTDATPSELTENPLMELHIPKMLAGGISPNWLTVVGISPKVSIVVFYTVLCILVGIGLKSKSIDHRPIDLRP